MYFIGLTENDGEVAKSYALESIKKFLTSVGLGAIDVDAIDKMIAALFSEMDGELKDQLVKAIGIQKGK